MYYSICQYLKILALKLHPFQQKVILQTVRNLFSSEHYSFLFKPCSMFSSTTSCTRWYSWRKVEIRPEWEKGNLAWPVLMEQGGRTVFNFPCLSRYGLQQVTSITFFEFHQCHACVCVWLPAGTHVQLEYVWMCKHLYTFLYIGSLWLNWMEKSHCVSKHICSFYQQARMWSLSQAENRFIVGSLQYRNV